VQGKTPQPTPLASGTPVSIPVTTPLSVPASGIVVRVSYIGGFSGTYGIDGEGESARDSGDKIYALNKTSGTVFATFKKEDGTERHEITAEIIRDGKTLEVCPEHLGLWGGQYQLYSLDKPFFVNPARRTPDKIRKKVSYLLPAFADFSFFSPLTFGKISSRVFSPSRAR
jgi:hypothetical protein